MAQERIEKSRACLLSGLLLTGLTASCGTPLNLDDGLLGENPLPAVALRHQDSSDPPPATILGEIAPLDRSTWTRRAILINQAQVQHHPSYGSARPVLAALDSKGACPSLETSFSNGSNLGDEALNGALAPLAAAAELVILPLRMIITPPWGVMKSPRGVRMMPSSEQGPTSTRTVRLDSATKDERK